MKLSILICALNDRVHLLERLMSVLRPQLNSVVEVIVDIDNGEKTIGKKRNNLLARAKGDYVAFVDDDDLVSEDYVAKISKAIESGPDCCSLTGEISIRNNPKRKFIHSIDNEWCFLDGVYYRYPNHVNAIKRELAVKVGFPEHNYGEDKVFADQVRPLLKTEVKIEGVIYYYFPGCAG